MLADLRKSLYAVPLVQTLGVVPIEVRPGLVAMSLPHRPSLLDHSGALHTAALFGVAELAAAIVLATHPDLVGFEPRRASASVRYGSPSYGDVTARAELTSESVAAILAHEPTTPPGVSVPVRIHDAVDNDIMVVEAHFVLSHRPNR